MQQLGPDATVIQVNKMAVAKAQAYCTHKCRSTKSRL